MGRTCCREMEADCEMEIERLICLDVKARQLMMEEGSEWRRREEQQEERGD